MTVYKVWDCSTCVYEGTELDAVLIAWSDIPDVRRNDRALCQIDADGVNATSRILSDYEAAQ